MLGKLIVFKLIIINKLYKFHNIIKINVHKT